MSDRADELVFAAVPYANAAPLAYFLDKVAPNVRVIYDKPAKLAGLLAGGQADVALIPVVDYFAGADLKMIDGLGVCADGDIWSVLLKCDKPIEHVRAVAADPASKTSNVLAAIVLHKGFGLSVPLVAGGDATDAAVVIGDRALVDPPAACADYDLAGKWKEITGLAFVFAVWAYRADRTDGQVIREIAHQAKADAMAGIDQLANEQARRLGISRQRCHKYLTEVVRYDLDSRCAEGMKLFRELSMASDPAATERVLPVRREPGDSSG